MKRVPKPKFFKRGDVPDWYLRINDMVAQSPLMEAIRHFAETGEKKDFGKTRWKR